MAKLLINVDVSDLERGVEFYTRAFTLQVGRRLGPDVVELIGVEAPIYLLRKAPDSTPYPRAPAAHARDYGRHWTPVHLDFAVGDLESALARALAAGARAESPIAEHAWGRIVFLSDPFGHGVCLLQFSAQGYDALTSNPNG